LAELRVGRYISLEYEIRAQRRITNGVHEYGQKLGEKKGCSGLDGPAFPAENTV